MGPPRESRNAKTPRSRNRRVILEHKTPARPRSLADSDPRRGEYGSIGLGTGMMQRQRRLAQEVSLKLFVDAERLGQLPGAPRELPRIRVESSARPHARSAYPWIDCAQKHRGPMARRAGRDVHAPMHTVAAVDVEAARRPKHHGVALRGPPEAMACRVVRAVGFALDDRAAHPCPIHGRNNPHAEQVSRHLRYIALEEVALDGLSQVFIAC